MMAIFTPPKLRTALFRSDAGRDDGLRRVAARLAGQTVVLLLIMLIALEGVVYIITQQALIGSLKATLSERASAPDVSVYNIFRLGSGTSGQPGFRGGPRGPGPFGPGGPPPNLSLNPSDASAVYVTPDLQIRHYDGALGKVLLDGQEIRRAVLTNRTQCCAVRRYKGVDYLLYTGLLRSNGKVAGAVQTSISEHQYEQTMQALLQALLVVAILGLLISGGISAILVHRSLEPIRAAVARQRDFVADAAHELRTPLAIQRTVGEVGMGASSAADLQGTVAQMLAENQHLTRLVEDLSLLARTDTNTVAIERRPVDLSSVVTETAEEIGFLAEAQGVALAMDVQPSVRVAGDVLRLRQLLLILLDNALKHTPNGGQATVRLSRQGERALLQVADSGPGIASADLPRIFDRFYRSDRARAGEGSGLGLAIGRWIAEAHGGQIQASNVPESGAVFTVTLPALKAGMAL